MLRTHIQAPYKAYNGAILPEWACKEYNAIQDQINAWTQAKRNPPEWLVDWSFRRFNEFCLLFKGDV